MFPMNEWDPITIESNPHIYFAGVSSRFETLEFPRIGIDVKVAMTRLVCITSFAKACY